MSAPRVLVVCALPRELADFDPSLVHEILSCGVGPVEAGVAVAARLARGDVDVVVNAGIGGAFEGRGEVGSCVAIAREHLADLGLEGGAPLRLPDGATLVDYADADATLVRVARDAGLRIGRGVTVSLVTTTDATGASRRDRYDADVESMEGFAVLRAAARAGVPAIEVRGVSNLARDRARSRWDFAAGAQATASALHELVTRLHVSPKERSRACSDVR